MDNAINPTKVNRLLLALTAAAIPLGLIAQGVGRSDVAAAVWAIPTALTLLPLVFSVIQSFRQRSFGVDIIALLAMSGALALHEFLGRASATSAGRQANSPHCRPPR